MTTAFRRLRRALVLAVAVLAAAGVALVPAGTAQSLDVVRTRAAGPGALAQLTAQPSAQPAPTPSQVPTSQQPSDLTTTPVPGSPGSAVSAVSAELVSRRPRAPSAPPPGQAVVGPLPGEPTPRPLGLPTALAALGVFGVGSLLVRVLLAEPAAARVPGRPAR